MNAASWQVWLAAASLLAAKVLAVAAIAWWIRKHRKNNPGAQA